MRPLGGFEYRVSNDAGSSNAPFLVAGHALPSCSSNEQQPHAGNGPGDHSAVRDRRPHHEKRDRDWYAFTAKKGEPSTSSSSAIGSASSTYMYFMLRNFETKADITESQDNNGRCSNVKFYSTDDDPLPYRFMAPADGKYLADGEQPPGGFAGQAAPALSRSHLAGAAGL